MIRDPSGTRTFNLLLTLALCLLTAFVDHGSLAAAAERPLVVTIDDLPIAAGRYHETAAERERITRELLQVLARHEIQAVGLVVWQNFRAGDERLLEAWLAAGHELGNHSYSHLDYTRTGAPEFIADVERGREELARFLEPRGHAVRFFRFPLLHEGDTREKLLAMREYLARSEQRNLPVTIDDQDWSFERPWVRARLNEAEAALVAVGQDYQASLRTSVRHHERTGDRLFDRPVPQILLLHANEVGAAQWDRLFTWLEATGHRFATVDEVLQDPVFRVEHEFVGPAGYGLWDRLLAERLDAIARKEVTELLQEQAADWNRGDLEAFCSAYAEDAVFISPSGMTRGRQEILERYRQRYPDRSAMGTLTLEALDLSPAHGVEVSMLGDATPGEVHGMSVAARWTLSYAEGENASGLTLIVMRRRRDGWVIVQDASM